MSLIDRASTFRGKVIDHAVGVTRNEFPQFVCSLIATEIWDEEEQVWVSLADVELDANEIHAYVVLYGSKGETLSFNQVKKVFNWDGASFQVLNDGDYSEVGIQFRVVESTYEGKTRLKVEWIDEYDAEPGRSVRKLDPDELKQLDAKYAQYLKAGGKKTAPAKAPTKISGTGKGTVTTKGAKPTSPKGPVKKKLAKQTATEATPDSAPPLSLSNIPPDEVAKSTDPNLPAGSCTKNEAWDEIAEMRDKKVTDQKLAESWANAIGEISGGKGPDKLTDEDWFLVKEKVMAETAVF